MAAAKTPAQIRQLLRKSDGPVEKIRRKPKIYNPKFDKRNTDRNKFKESFSSESC